MNGGAGQIHLKKCSKGLNWKYGAQQWQEENVCSFLNAVRHGSFEKHVMESHV